MAEVGAELFVYEQISSSQTIRLIHVQPGIDNEPLRVSLTEASFKDDPDYEAISYCWGSEADRATIKCNGKTVSVTKSLATGLAHFRLKERPRVLWADAICINQGDDTEKGHQVLLMPQIYSRASRVLIWLGLERDPNCGILAPDIAGWIRRALSMLPALKSREDVAEIAQRSKELVVEANELKRQGKPNLLEYDWRPLATLLARPWFRRKWIVQEVTLAKEAILYAGGGLEIAWVELGELVFRMEVLGVTTLAVAPQEERDTTRHEKLEQHTEKGHAGLSPHSPSRGADESKDWELEYRERSLHKSLGVPLHCASIILMVQYYRSAGTALDAVVGTGAFQCREPKDCIYSVISLVSQGPVVRPDYSLSDAEAFQQFAEAMLVEGNSLKILGLAPEKILLPREALGERLQGLPTWAPDLRHIGEYDPLISYTIRPQLFFAGGKDTKPSLSLSEDRRILRCKGRVIETITDVAKSLFSLLAEELPDTYKSREPPTDDDKDRTRRRQAVWIKDSYRTAFGDTGETPPDPEQLKKFSRTMLCDMTNMRDRATEGMIDSFMKYMRFQLDLVDNPLSYQRDDLEDLLKFGIQIDQTLASVSLARRLCRTDSGGFGLVPFGAKSGDKICIFLGGEVPFVIRPAGGETFTLVGECYLDGVMNGELFDAWTGDAESLETIQLE